MEIVSVTQLLRLLDGGTSPTELRERWGIQSLDVTPNEAERRTHQSLKRPRTEAGDLQARVVSFTSTCVWITGFLQYERGDGNSTTATLCLGDTTSCVPVHLLDPQLELLDALILVKEWTVMQTTTPDSTSPMRRLMEVHNDPVLLRADTHQSPLQMEDAIATLTANYTAIDPPMYVGSTPWAPARGDSTGERSTPTDQRKGKKRKVHAVVGRISCISPISMQEHSASSHFFVEVESLGGGGAIRSLVNVLFAGTRAIRWYPFLRPRVVLLITNLKKIYYTESDMFLLQATFGDNAMETDDSRIHVWRSSPGASRLSIPDATLPVFERQSSHRGTIDVDGVVTSIIWDDCLVLDGAVPVVVSLFHYPWANVKDHLRVGCRVFVSDAHVLYRPGPVRSRLIVGLCPRGHLRISCHAPSSSRPISSRSSGVLRRAQKKWSTFGNFNRQSLIVSMWWLDLLEALVQKFRFGSDASERGGASGVSFSCIGRREATLTVGQDVFSAATNRDYSPLTLASRFLKSHVHDCDDCPSIRNDDHVVRATKRVITLRELVVFIEKKACETMASTESEPLKWPLHVEAVELSVFGVAGVLRGCVDSNDVEIADFTAVIPIIFEQDGNHSAVSTYDGCAVYALDRFSAIVEECEDKSDHGQKQTQLVVSLQVSCRDVQRVSLCSNASHVDPPRPGYHLKTSILLVFVTHVGPWKRQRRFGSIKSEFRHMRGIAFQTREGMHDVDWNSMQWTELLVHVECESWYIQRYRWFVFQDVRYNIKAVSSPAEARLEAWWQLLQARVQSNATDGVADNAVESVAEACWVDASRERVSAESMSYVVEKHISVRPIKLVATEDRYGADTAFVCPLNSSVLRCVTLLESFIRKSVRKYTIRDLFVLKLQIDDPYSTESYSSIESDPHNARLINLIGVISERKLYMKIQPTNHNTSNAASLSATGVDSAGSTRSRMCRLKIRDTRYLEAVTVTVDEDAFGTLSALQPGLVVEISMVQCFIARASFKPFLNWTHRTTARRVENDHSLQVVSEGQLFAQMPTTHLSSMYKINGIDRTVKRYVVRLAHLSYAMLKRRCSQCKQPLALVKRQRRWIHAAALNEESYPSSTTVRTCSWKQIAQDSPEFLHKTFLSCSMRCIIDDGSAQSELFLENDVVWELLRCSHGQRRRFEELVSRQTSNLSYFATRSSGESLFTSPSAQETIYYQNEWRAFIQDTVKTLGTFVVFAQRFYKAQQVKATPHTAVLSFGKDIQITTPSVPLVHLEAVRVDALHPKHELRRRLASIALPTAHVSRSAE